LRRAPPVNERPVNERPVNERPVNERPANESPVNEQTGPMSKPAGERRECRLVATVPSGLAGSRLDRALAALFPDFSRTRLQKLLLSGAATVNERPAAPKARVSGGERVAIDALAEAPPAALEPEAIALRVVHEDASLMVIDKPAGLVVHPGAGNPRGTLANALLHHHPTLAAVPRAGLIHRLDKDTTGLLLIARTPRAHRMLVEALARRRIAREYQAVVNGRVTAGGRIEAPIGRHPSARTRMAVVGSGRSAVTHYRVQARFAAHTALRVTLETGRTHQIRVHMAHLGHPLVGDPAYGRLRIPRGASPALAAVLRAFRRPALHAARLAFEHPLSGEALTFTAPLPADLRELLAVFAGEGSDP